MPESVRNVPVFKQSSRKSDAGGGAGRDGSPESVRSGGSKRKRYECPLCYKIPEIVKTGNEVEDLKRDGQREDLRELLELVWQDPNRIAPALKFVKKSITQEEAPDNAWGATVPGSIQQVPKARIVKFFAECGLSHTMLDEANSKDDSLLPQLFALSLHVSPSLSIPAEGKEDAETFWRWARGRTKDIKRLELISNNLSSEGYDKQKGGAYVLTWKDGRAEKVTHTATGDTFNCDESFNISQDWKLNQWHSDLLATVSRNRALNMKLADVFKPSAGPYKHILSKAEFEKKIVAFTSAASDTGPQVVVAEAGEELMQKSRLVKQQEAAAKAKSHLQAFREAKAAKSTVDLSAPPPPQETARPEAPSADEKAADAAEAARG